MRRTQFKNIQVFLFRQLVRRLAKPFAAIFRFIVNVIPAEICLRIKCHYSRAFELLKQSRSTHVVFVPSCAAQSRWNIPQTAAPEFAIKEIRPVRVTERSEKPLICRCARYSPEDRSETYKRCPCPSQHIGNLSGQRTWNNNELLDSGFCLFSVNSIKQEYIRKEQMRCGETLRATGTGW